MYKLYLLKLNSFSLIYVDNASRYNYTKGDGEKCKMMMLKKPLRNAS